MDKQGKMSTQGGKHTSKNQITGGFRKKARHFRHQKKNTEKFELFSRQEKKQRRKRRREPGGVKSVSQEEHEFLPTKLQKYFLLQWSVEICFVLLKSKKMRIQRRDLHNRDHKQRF